MAARFQLVIDCAKPGPLARGLGTDCIIDPDGSGPRIWFQVVPERKTAKNRLHLDIKAGGGRELPIETRRKRVN